MTPRVVIPIIAALTVLSGAASAAYPERPIKLIVAYGAGSTDSTARALAPVLARRIAPGARVDVVGIPGAGGENGFTAIAEAQPDGYTIGFVNLPSVVTIPIERNARYNPNRFDPLLRVVVDPCVWSVRSDAPFASLKDLLAEAARNPNTLTIGSSGFGSDDHLSILRMRKLAGAKLVHVPFAGGEPVTRAVMDGKITVAAQNLGEASNVRQNGGALRVLGVMSAERWAIAPDVPTFREQGYAVSMSAMRGVVAPRGLPPVVRAALIEALTESVTDPEFYRFAVDPKTTILLDIGDSAAFVRDLGDAAVEYRALWADNPWID